MLNDTEWMGDDAHLAPAVRVGLGILLERRDWSWWGNPRLVSDALERAVPPNGIAKWGGDSSVLEAHGWLDPLLAVAIAKGIRFLHRRRPLRIRIVRAVWHWSDIEVSIDEIAADLATVVGRERVFAEWPRDTRRPFPLSDRRQSLQPIITVSPDIEQNIGELIRSQPLVTWSPDAQVTDVFVASSLQYLYRIRAARFVIVSSGDAREVFSHVQELRERIRAQCVVHVDADKISSIRWLSVFLSAWSQSRTLVDEALELANAESSATARIVASTQSFILNSAKFLRPEPDHRLHGSRYIDEFEPKEQLPSIHRKIIPNEPAYDFAPVYQQPFTHREVGSLKPTRDFGRHPSISPPTVRVLDARVMDGPEQVDILPLQGLISILLDIRLKTPLHGSRPPFPEDKVEWEGDSKVLQIHMLEFDRPSVSNSIKVFRHGNSEIANFPYVVNNKPVDLRFLLSDGSRILQTARLRGDPASQIEFYIESIAGPVQQDKQSFDVALLVNDSLGGQPSITTLTKDGILLSPLGAVDAENSRNELLRILERVVIDPDAPIAPVLLELANQGSMLLTHLKDNVEGWPDRIERVQLMTQSNAFFPLEYLYEGNVPESTKADLCPERYPCLNSGKARSPCPIREAATYLCPMGFLGVSAMVERHTWQRGKPADIWIGLAQDYGERYKITDLKRAVFSASDLADNFNDSELPIGVAPVRIDDIAKKLDSNCLTDWGEWKKQVAEIQPSLLVLLVHIENSQLFIGNEEGLNLAALSTRHVGAGQPVAIAIGCSSGYGKIPGSNLPAALMRNGARVVVAAMTDVLGRHANRAALYLAERFRNATESHTPIAVGELMNKLRREFLAEDIALGLALAAFGDADIALGGR